MYPLTTLGEKRYIPSNPEIVALQEMIDNPTEHFLPSRTVDGKEWFLVGGSMMGLIGELEELFTFPKDVLRRQRGTEDEGLAEAPAEKRQRVEGEQEEDVEQGRRTSVVARSEIDPFQFGADQTFDMSMGFDQPMDQQGDIGTDAFEFSTPRAKRQQQQREASLAPSRAESIARQIQYGDVEGGQHPLAIFDSGMNRESESLQETPTKSSMVSGEASRTGSGYSKHTGMAMGLLRRELEAIEEEEKVLQFDRLADKVS